MWTTLLGPNPLGLLSLLMTIITTLLDGVVADCVIEENSRAFVPVCDIKGLFTDIEVPHVDSFSNIFRLSGTNLELLQSLDRESLIANQKCDAKKLANFNSLGQCVLVLDLSGLGPKFYQLPILVADVNDNTPSFDHQVFNIRVPENAASNVEVELPHARDPDRGRNGTVTYSLQKSAASHKFVLLNPSPNGALDSPLKLKIIQPFDREVEEEVKLIIIAKDLGDPPLSSSLIVKIEITDVNDHSPEFNQTSYRFNIPESILQGQSIGRVFASDRDVSNLITIMMSPSASSQIMDKFTIAPDGVISTKTPLEYTSSNYDFRIPVIAVDGGTPSMTATTTVFVQITDVNDNSPVIEVTSSHSNNRLFLTENSPPNTYIAKVTAKDKDYGNNGQVECRLENNHLFNLESISNFDNRRYYKLVTAPLSNFDRETQESYPLSIICNDKGVPSQTTTRSVTVIIKDENDNPPIFPQPRLFAKIMENKPSGTRVITLKAVDRDYGVNSQINYKLADESLAQFNIEPFSGIITSRGQFDREQTTTITIKATAYDRQRPNLQSNVTVNVTVLDENDNVPRFTKGLSFHVKENTEGPIGRVEAVDDDEGRNKEIEYYLTIPSDTFQITSNGQIIVPKKSRLDREKMDHYSLEVTTKDRGHSPLSSTTVVEIMVDDVNDNPPIFHKPQPGQKINISISTLPGTIIFTAEATDQDFGINAKVIYSIKPHGTFVINSSDGGIFLNGTLTHEVDLPARLQISAQDCGNPSLTATTLLVLHYVHSGIATPTRTDKRTEPRTSSSRDLILSLGIGMVLLIFTCLMMLVTYFCVSIFIQKRRQQTEDENKGHVGRESRPSRLHGLCIPNNYDDQEHQELATTVKVRGLPINTTLEGDQNYPICFNRIDQMRENDPLYGYREFTMKPNVNADQSPFIYDRLTSMTQSANPYWQYNTIGHHSHRPSYPSYPVNDHGIQEVIYHHGLPRTIHHSHPDIVNSNSSDEVNKIIYGDLSPPSVQSPMKPSVYPQQDYDNEKLRYESNINLSSVEMLCQQNDVDHGFIGRFAGYVVGSPCYANSFV